MLAFDRVSLIFAGEVLGDAEVDLEAEGRLRIETVDVSIRVDGGLGGRVGRLRRLGQVLSGCAGRVALAGRSGCWVYCFGFYFVI